jgi:pimeloyl-ACP methyl ester carboxylesterase
VPFIDLVSSPLAPGVSPVRIHYRDVGAGRPILFLHGGWGYELYPFDRQAAAFSPAHRIVIPDRSGYGKSIHIDALPADFHQRAVEETRLLLEAIGLNRPIVWGHSDGAIIALLLALAAPERIAGAIVEATHFYKQKPQSREFFESVAANPEVLGESTTLVLARDHGPDWAQLITRHSRTWRQIAVTAASASEDFYGGRLSDIAVPVLMIHGARDPRTEPGEIDALQHALGAAGAVVILREGGHSPHSARTTADEVTQVAQKFIARVLTAPATRVAAESRRS